MNSFQIKNSFKKKKRLFFQVLFKDIYTTSGSNSVCHTGITHNQLCDISLSVCVTYLSQNIFKWLSPRNILTYATNHLSNLKRGNKYTCMQLKTSSTILWGSLTCNIHQCKNGYYKERNKKKSKMFVLGM